MRKSILVAGLLLLSPAVTQAKTLDELLVEKGVITKGEAASTSEGAAGSVSWKNGNRFSYPSEGITATVATLLQSRYTFTDNDQSPNTSSFDTERAKIVVSGTMLHDEFSYVLETDMVGSTDGTGANSPQLQDAYIRWQACDWVALKMGQFKTAISRQFNTSDWKMQFVDRTQVSEYFDLGRQEGLAAGGDLMDGELQLGAAIYNGESDGEGINRSGVDTRHTGAVAVRWNALGKMNPYEEGDIGWTEDAAVSLGAAYAHSAANNDVGAGLEQADRDTISVDGNFKYQGWSIHGEFFYQSQDADSFDDSNDATGFYAQVGYFLDPKVWEIAARYGLLDCDSGKASGQCSGNDQLNEVDATINYYFWKHNLKAQFGYEFLQEEPEADGADDINTNRWIFQISAYL